MAMAIRFVMVLILYRSGLFGGACRLGNFH